MAREGKRDGGERQQVPITLTTNDFVQRGCLHVQPDQMTKTRYMGGWSNNRQGNYVSRCRDLLASLKCVAGAEADTKFVTEPPHETPDLTCDQCGSERMELVSETAKPSWSEPLWRETDTCPMWYADRQREWHRRLWTAAYDTDFFAIGTWKRR
ncbi:hypothetical protein Poly21_19120 [Allorhodopirellula heiligendammensis]|uniref:Uncharacterized protein n=2 Tax=Allorhodopirellula heiligendammensis TaxID=2714739 RepID=A0A5C6C6W6_9BACT|nr:hypothetical protein Poly21_19120 [Allorhodopirellula heiligendammensis]